MTLLNAGVARVVRERPLRRQRWTLVVRCKWLNARRNEQRKLRRALRQWQASRKWLREQVASVMSNELVEVQVPPGGAA